MDDQAETAAAARRRVVEGWLPLAQEANRAYAWNLPAPDLEALILAAAPALEYVCSSFAACAVLWAFAQRRSAGGTEPTEVAAP